MRNFHLGTLCILVFLCFCLWTSGSRQEKEAKKNDPIKLVITARDMIPSQLPPSYVELLDPNSPKCLLQKEDIVPDRFLFWSFFIGTLGPKDGVTRENLIILIAMNPKHIRPMMPELKGLEDKLVERFMKNPQAALVGRDQLTKLKKRVGDKIKVTSTSFAGIAMEFEIIGELPAGRLSQSAIMHEASLKQAFIDYEKQTGKAHPSADKWINLMWLHVPHQAAFERVKAKLETSPEFKAVPLQCDTEEEAARKLK